MTILAVRAPATLRVISPLSDNTADILRDLEIQKLQDSDDMLIRDGEDMWVGTVWQFRRGMLP